MKDKITILLVEDENLVLIYEKSILERHGYLVETALNAEDAICLALEKDFNLILMDMELGGTMSGPEAAVEILKHKELPIVFCTGHSEKEMVEKVRNIGIYGYIYKKSGEFVLIESIRIALELFEARSILKEDINKRQQVEKDLLNSEKMLKRIAENIPNSYLSVISADYKIGYTAGPGFRKSGIDPVQFIGSDLKSIFGEHTEFIRAEYEKTFKGELREFELYINNEYQVYRTFPLYDDDGSIPKILSIVENITEQKNRENALKVSQERYRKAQKLGNVGNWEYNLQTTEFWGSEQAKRIYGLDADSMMFTTEEVERCIPERERVHKALVDLIESGKEYDIEFDIIAKDTKERKTISSLANLERDKDGNPLVVNGVVHDVTEIKKVKDNLTKALAQKELLLNELDHRVKNNLMMVSSLIDFKDYDLGNTADLSDLKNQIDAIMNTYNSLYHTDDVSRISIKDYLMNIISNIFDLSVLKIKVDISCSIDDISSSIAVFLGLIVNETAVNALKHGFADVNDPIFTVVLNHNLNENKLLLTISNNGLAMPDSVELDNPGTLGLRLITAIVGQLHGDISIKKSPHPVFSISFPDSYYL